MKSRRLPRTLNPYFGMAACALILGTACGGPTGNDSGHPFGNRVAVETPMDIPLWVEVACDPLGEPVYGRYSIVKLPSEKVMWSLAMLDTNDCRLYGAIVPSTQTEPDLCDIRFRSKVGITNGKCRCVPGKYDLEEGRPTAQRCCEKYPNAVYCKTPEIGPKPLPPPQPPRQTP